jgi:apolipoprotein D and lipocalin family protein
MRRGLGVGKGSGYHNIIPRDPMVHSQSAKGVKQPQSFFGLFMAKPELQRVKSVDLKRYAGKWYQVKALPVWFQQGCKNVTAEYTAQPDGSIRVKNSCMKDGKSKVAFGTARTTKTTGKLAVTFDQFPFIAGDYNIIYTDYDAALVGTEDRKSLWILSRRPTIEKTKYQRLVDIAKKQGYDIKRLVS